MVLQQQLLWGALIPALIAASFILLALKPWQKEPLQPASGAPGATLGFGLAYLLTHSATKGAPTGLPQDALDWIFYLAPAAIIVGLIEAKFHKNIILVTLLRLGLAFLGFWLSLGFMREHYWDQPTSALWLSGLTFGTLAIITAFDRTAESWPGASAPLAMVLLTAAASAVLVMTGNAKIAFLMAGLLATSLAALLLSWIFPRLRLSRGPSTVFGLIFAGLLAFGYAGSADIPALAEFWRDRQTAAMGLVAAAPLMLWVSRAERLGQLPDAAQALLRALLLALPLAGGVFVASQPAQETKKLERFEEFQYELSDEEDS